VIEDPFTRPLELWDGTSPVFVRSGVKDGKSIGVRPSLCDGWFSDHSLCDVVLVEADGARHRPFKAPANFEPVLPDQTTTVLAVIGADALGRVIADQCHRPLRVAAAAGCSPYERLTPARAATVLTSPYGSFKGCPTQARKVVVITKVPSEKNDPITSDLVEELVDALTPNNEVVSIEFEHVE
jgi:probable selenium-dependent hydroxylase accessory protein YqeC